ncbi:hypothetical protein [Nocardioides sp. B-3]|uniref:hypothetical protein n=1 Tax=Nocardioides sp. B-3 TaxID=2895565 RepID=UPI00215364F5|nr:hypothetical protein [Nocardioides sp. B-3]UUZ60196.1 hypothetical protein LP418_04445 [Nocardioides sp. B-3]
MSAPTISVPTALDAGHLPGSTGYRRVVIALFAAGLATFELLYSTRAILPALAAPLRRLLDRDDADPLAGDPVARCLPARRGPALRRGRPHPADPPLDDALGDLRRRLRARPDLGRRCWCCAA